MKDLLHDAIYIVVVAVLCVIAFGLCCSVGCGIVTLIFLLSVYAEVFTFSPSSFGVTKNEIFLHDPLKKCYGIPRPEFGAVSAGIILLVAGLWYFFIVFHRDVSELSKAWSGHWPEVSQWSAVISLCLVASSWLNPGVFWHRIQPWAQNLDTRRENLRTWTPAANGWEKGKWKDEPLNDVQTALVKSHRECALWWLAFWTLVPPVWFLLEYSAATSDMCKDSNELVRFTRMQDLARSVWVAWVAALATWHGVISSPFKM